MYCALWGQCNIFIPRKMSKLSCDARWLDFWVQLSGLTKLLKLLANGAKLCILNKFILLRIVCYFLKGFGIPTSDLSSSKIYISSSNSRLHKAIWEMQKRESFISIPTQSAVRCAPIKKKKWTSTPICNGSPQSSRQRRWCTKKCWVLLRVAIFTAVANFLLTGGITCLLLLVTFISSLCADGNSPATPKIHHHQLASYTSTGCCSTTSKIHHHQLAIPALVVCADGISSATPKIHQLAIPALVVIVAPPVRHLILRPLENQSITTTTT